MVQDVVCALLYQHMEVTFLHWKKSAVYLNIMAQKKDKICIELAFNKTVSYSQQIKVKDFWKFLDATKPIKPYEIKLDKKVQKTEEKESPKCKRKWYNQLRVMQENGLDKVALATGGECKLCYNQSNYTNSGRHDAIEESYDELLNDMKAFDKRSDNKRNGKLAESKKSSILCIGHPR